MRRRLDGYVSPFTLEWRSCLFHWALSAASRSNCDIRCGVMGISKMPMPHGASASEIALSTAAGAPIVPPSPTPLAPVMLASVNVSK